MAGNPDSVFEQMKHFHDEVGGFGNLIPLVHYSTMSYDTVVKSMERFSTHVLPRFRDEIFEPSKSGKRELVGSGLGR